MNQITQHRDKSYDKDINDMITNKSKIIVMPLDSISKAVNMV